MSHFNVHEMGRDLERTQALSPWQRIKPKLGSERFISAVVDDAEFKDHIYCAVPDEADKEIARLEKTPGDITLTLRAGTPPDGDDQSPRGLYGVCQRIDDGLSEHYLTFDLYLPEHQLHALVDALDRAPNLNISVKVFLLSYDNEAEASLREWYFPQYLFIDGVAGAPISFVQIRSVPALNIKISKETETGLQYMPTDLSPVTKAVRTLTVALWVLVAVISYLLLK